MTIHSAARNLSAALRSVNARRRRVESAGHTVQMKISPLQLFIAFSQMALSGFGGVLPFAYRALVERRRWLSAEEFRFDRSVSKAIS